MTGRWNGRSERRRRSFTAVVALGLGVALALLAAAGMTEANERPTIPDQDPPVSETRYSKSTSTLLVIGRADEAGERLIVLTASTTDS